MIYQSYQFQEDMIAPWRNMALFSKQAMELRLWGKPPDSFNHLAAGLEMVSRFALSHERPQFGITETVCEGERIHVNEHVVLDLPFGKLIHFQKETNTDQPKILLIAPLSGHFATLLRATVDSLLPDHEVYITDWANARDVPLAAGQFGVDDYVTYLIRFLEEIGSGSHILAVCQPCVQALAAVALMSEDDHPATPLSMTLMAGPIDPRESPTKVNELAVHEKLSWFENNVVATVPARYAGRGRRVYPGFVQLVSFMSMNMERHQRAHRKLYYHLAAGEWREAEKIKAFYDEYFAVLDLPEEFYIETIDRVFQQAQLALGKFTYQGRVVDPSAIRKTALLTVEGGRDDICGLGQTSVAHELCSSLRPHLKRHHMQANAGHYSVFAGRHWDNEIRPTVLNMILAME